MLSTADKSLIRTVYANVILFNRINYDAQEDLISTCKLLEMENGAWHNTVLKIVLNK